MPFLGHTQRILHECAFHMKFVIRDFGEFNKFKSVRFCLSYDLLNAILSPIKFIYFGENV